MFMILMVISIHYLILIIVIDPLHQRVFHTAFKKKNIIKQTIAESIIFKVDKSRAYILKEFNTPFRVVTYNMWCRSNHFTKKLDFNIMDFKIRSTEQKIMFRDPIRSRNELIVDCCEFSFMKLNSQHDCNRQEKE